MNLLFSSQWRDYALCKNKSYLFFDLEKNERPPARARREAKAKELCAKCPVIDACRQYGRDTQSLGVWGGETEVERALAGFLPGMKEVNRRVVRHRNASEQGKPQ